MRLFKPNIQKMQSREDFKGLIKALTDRDAEVRDAAADVLYRFGEKSFQPLINTLMDEDPLLRAVAAEVLCGFGDQAVTPLVRALKHPDPRLRYAAAELISRFRAFAVEPLKQALRDSDMSVRRAAAEGLGKVSPYAKTAIEPLMAAIRDIESQTSMQMLLSIKAKVDLDRHRMDGVASLAEASGQLQEAIAGFGPLQQQLDRIEQDRQPFLKTLEELFMQEFYRRSPYPEPHIPEQVMSALQDRCFLIRQVAASTLGRIGGSEAMELLTTLSKDQSDAVRKVAKEALHQLGLAKQR